MHGYTRASLSTGSYTVTVGAGGAGGTGWNTSSQDGKIGGNSSVFSITSTGGGGGVHHGGATTSTNKNGGSGGGGANGSYDGGAGINTQGNNGGNNGNGNLGAGGGGAGSVGGNASGSYGGSGGLGKYYGYSFGASVGYDGWFADGGAGGVRGYAGTFVRTATHGGGSGTSTTTTAGNGSTNTGSGGGGGGYNASSSSRIGGNGGSGVVIIRYKGSQKASGGDSIFNYKGFTVHVFTSSGTFTVGDRVGGLSTSKIVGTLTNMDSSNYNSGNKGYFTFDGTNESFLLSSSFLYPVNWSDPFSIETFMYVPDTAIWNWLGDSNYPQGTSGSIFFKGNYQGGIGLIRRGGYTVAIPDNTVSLWMRGTSTQHYVDGVITRNKWWHVCGTYDGSTMYLYLNGISQNTKSVASNTIGGSPSTSQWDIGLNHSMGGNQGNRYTGNISNLKVYNKALSANEVEQNYNATKGRFGL